MEKLRRPRITERSNKKVKQFIREANDRTEGGMHSRSITFGEVGSLKHGSKIFDYEGPDEENECLPNENQDLKSFLSKLTLE